MGILIFWLNYIIAGILLYLILRCIYVKGENNKEKCSIYRIYTKTDKDIRLKHPLWAIILFLFAFTIPIFNLIVFTVYLLQMTVDTDGNDECRYYCKSIFNKEY